MNATPCVICTASTETSGRSMGQAWGEAIHRVSSTLVEFGTVAGGRSAGTVGPGSMRSGETRRAKRVRRGALDAATLARGRAGITPRHAEPPIELHPLLLAIPPASAGIDRAIHPPMAGTRGDLRARELGRRATDETVGEIVPQAEAPNRDCHPPRNRSGADRDRTVSSGRVEPRISTRRHPRGKGVLPE